MKKLISMACVGLIGAMCLAADNRAPIPAAGEIAAAAARPMGKLIVHEWGTFTGFAGSDGVHLPFNTLFGLDLPEFVMNRQKQALRENPKLQIPVAFQKGGGAAALQRMETPVVYFYADAPGTVNVEVEFPQGSLTEFYPPVRSMAPPYGTGFGEFGRPTPAASGAAAQTRPAESFLNWGNVRIVPHPSGNEGKLIPADEDGSHYFFARKTDSALVQFADAGGTRREEKFLFYRGLGNFTLPVTLRALGGDRFELRNAGASPITSAFLIQINRNDPKTARFTRLENVAGNQQLALPPANRNRDELSDAITKSLIGDGLYEKEARAMVETWKSTWLDEPGARVLYIVPRQVTDALLPLHIDPKPDETVRVLVGRIDVFTPEQEASLNGLMVAANPGMSLSDEDARMLVGLGRFLAPAMDRIGKLTGDLDHHQARQLNSALSRWQAKGK